MLSTFGEMNPEYSNQVNQILSENDQSHKKVEKESALVFGKLSKINESVGELRETLKYFDKTNESLLRVQSLT